MANEAFWQQTQDWHTAGAPFRIVTSLPNGSLTEGLTVAEHHLQIKQTPSHPLDLLRQSLSHEPRGHSNMYGGFILPPDDPRASFGVLFWHGDGFSTACGHGTIALGYWAITNGMAERNPGGTTDVVIDVPSGRVIAKAAFNGAGEVTHVDFVNVASYQISKGNSLSVTHDGKTIPLSFDRGFGGAVFAVVKAADLNLKVEPSNHRAFIEIAGQIKAHHADFLYLDKYYLQGVFFVEEKSESVDAIHQKNIMVYGDGMVDRSPCGSGTCARLAILLAQGRVSEDKHLVNESIIGSRFEAHVVERASSKSSFPGCIPRVRGQAHHVGVMTFFIDPKDPIFPGFLLN